MIALPAYQGMWVSPGGGSNPILPSLDFAGSHLDDNTIQFTVPAGPGISVGEKLILCGCANNTAGAWTCDDNSAAAGAANVYSVVDDQTDLFSGSNLRAVAFECEVTRSLASGDLISIHIPGAAHCLGVATVWDNLTDSGDLDQVVAAGGHDATPDSGATGTTAAGFQLALAFTAWRSDQSATFVTQPMGWIHIRTESESVRALTAAYHLFSGGGTIDAAETCDGTTYWEVLLATYLAAP